ncbi:hypothetical protein TNCV_813171 [Trichonephila clavipes]|nr:hypothetical protein TNCV_813171 [Trichonephila clavipes]
METKMYPIGKKFVKRVPDPWYNVSWGLPIHVTGRKFLNCVIPLHPRYEETEELYLNLYAVEFKAPTHLMILIPAKMNSLDYDDFVDMFSLPTSVSPLPPTSVASPFHEPFQDMIYDSLPPMGQFTVPESPLKDLLPVDSKPPVVSKPPIVSKSSMFLLYLRNL